jgi:hypothetical protein
VTALAKKAKCKLTVCPEEENLDDQWMQVDGTEGRGTPRGPVLLGLSLAPRWPCFLRWTGRQEPLSILGRPLLSSSTFYGSHLLLSLLSGPPNLTASLAWWCQPATLWATPHCHSSSVPVSSQMPQRQTGSLQLFSVSLTVLPSPNLCLSCLLSGAPHSRRPCPRHNHRTPA